MPDGDRAVDGRQPSTRDRGELGKAARAAVPRSRHGGWEPHPSRPDPLELLQQQASTRLPELIPIRYGRMLVSPFTFFRGAACVMAWDLAQEPRTALKAQLCGDAHLANFGTFGRDRGFDGVARRSVDLAVARSYREAMRSFAELRTLELWYVHLDRDLEEIVREWESRVSRKQLKYFERNIAKARAKDSLRAFAKLTRVVDGHPRIVHDPPLIVPIEALAGADDPQKLAGAVDAVVHYYRRTLPRDRRQLLERYRYIHAARKVVGVGSVGTRAWIMLMLGRDDRDPLFLQMKEAEASVLEPYLGRSEFENYGRRVVEGQRLMQAASDIMLGWIRTTEWIDGVNRDFYVRQLWDGKGSAPIDVLDPDALGRYGELCGWALARAHARSGDAVAIGSYLGAGNTFDRAMCVFADRYADQNERDHEALRHAAAAGLITARTGL
jgi:hypothetical protein